MKLKICLSIRSLNYGGASKMFLWLSESLARRGHEVTIISFTPILTDIKLFEGYKVVQLNLSKIAVPFNMMKMHAVLKECNPDVSVSFALEANVYNIFACIGLKTKSIICERNDPFLSKNFVLKLWKPCFRWADGAVWQLEKVSSFYNNVKVRTVVIPNPVVLEDVECDEIKNRVDAFVTHSRLDLFQKRQDVLIDAFCLFHKIYPNYKLYIYGTGPDEERIRNIIQSKGLNDIIILKGKTSHPLQDISQYKFYIFTSDFEGIPNSLIEAMSVGLPCVATDCSPGGAAFLIENTVNGLLVPRRNVEMLCEKMRFFVENIDMAERMGNKAKLIREKLKPEKIIEKWETYLSSVIQ